MAVPPAAYDLQCQEGTIRDTTQNAGLRRRPGGAWVDRELARQCHDAAVRQRDRSDARLCERRAGTVHLQAIELECVEPDAVQPVAVEADAVERALRAAVAAARRECGARQREGEGSGEDLEVTHWQISLGSRFAKVCSFDESQA